MKWKGLLAKIAEIRGSRARDRFHFVTAAKFYGRVVALKPGYERIWVQYGHALKESGDYANAELAYRRAIVLRPSNLEVHLLLAHLLKKCSRLREALDFFRSALVLDPSSDEIREEIRHLEHKVFKELQPTRIHSGPLEDRWQETYDAILPYLTADDVLLLPEASWPPFGCTTRLYNTDINLNEVTVLVLNKSRQSILGRERLVNLFANWQVLYVNGAFVVFATQRSGAPEVRGTIEERHLKSVNMYLNSREQKKRDSTVFFCHMPKSGGTSAWKLLTEVFQSTFYYKDIESFEASPPGHNEFDFVGGHCPFWLLEKALKPGDMLFSRMRDPTERFFSLIAHCRRQHLDPRTFTQSMRAMREMRVKDFLRTEDGQIEASMQLRYLGELRDGDNEVEAMFRRAETVLAREDVMVFPSRESAALAKILAQRLGFEARPIPHLNTTEASDYERYREEFEEAREELEVQNAAERRLFESVCLRFEAIARSEKAIVN